MSYSSSMQGIVLLCIASLLRSTCSQEAGVPKHLDRLDQPAGIDFKYNASIVPRAKPVLYVIDSGIYGGHAEFTKNQVINGYNFADESWNSGDCSGHGTHVAALATGEKVGVAGSIATDVVSVRLLDCAGRSSCARMVQAMEWVLSNHSRTRPDVPGVVVMSVGSTDNQCRSADTVAEVLMESNLLVIAAAGNNGIDACSVHPASSEHTVAVGALDYDEELKLDTVWGKSNFGTCVNVHAPGVSVRSAWPSGQSEYKAMTGTSMAAPLVAGQALLIRAAVPELPARLVRSVILNSASQGTFATTASFNPNLQGCRVARVPWKELSYLSKDGITAMTVESQGRLVVGLTAKFRTNPPMQYVADYIAERIRERLLAETRTNSDIATACNAMPEEVVSALGTSDDLDVLEVSVRDNDMNASLHGANQTSDASPASKPKRMHSSSQRESEVHQMNSEEGVSLRPLECEVHIGVEASMKPFLKALKKISSDKDHPITTPEGHEVKFVVEPRAEMKPQEEGSHKSKSNGAFIAGSVCAFMAAIAVIGGAIFFIRRRRNVSNDDHV